MHKHFSSNRPTGIIAFKNGGTPRGHKLGTPYLYPLK